MDERLARAIPAASDGLTHVDCSRPAHREEQLREVGGQCPPNAHFHAGLKAASEQRHNRVADLHSKEPFTKKAHERKAPEHPALVVPVIFSHRLDPH